MTLLGTVTELTLNFVFEPEKKCNLEFSASTVISKMISRIFHIYVACVTYAFEPTIGKIDVFSSSDIISKLETPIFTMDQN